MHSSRKYDHFIYLCHLREELVAARTDQEGALASDFKVMDERFIQIKHKTITSARARSTLLFWKIWWIRSG